MSPSLDLGKPHSHVTIQSSKSFGDLATCLTAPPHRNRFVVVFPYAFSVLALVGEQGGLLFFEGFGDVHVVVGVNPSV